MKHGFKLAEACSVSELDREIIARGTALPPEQRILFQKINDNPEYEYIKKQVNHFYEVSSLIPDPALSHLGTWELVEALRFKTRTFKDQDGRALWFDDNRQDFYEIKDPEIIKNTSSVAAICARKNLIDGDREFLTVKTELFGEVFGLCDEEPFFYQPTSAGRLCTGFLVEEDVIATAYHCINRDNITDLRFLFGYAMTDLSTPVTQIPKEDLYQGVELLQSAYNPESDKSDWALVKLDRKVTGREIVKLTERSIYNEQPVYILGHACALPLKYAHGAKIQAIKKTYFEANLDIFSGNSGSPVFDANTHEVVGIVARGNNQDFRWTGRGWMTIVHPNANFKAENAECIRTSEFIHHCY